MNKTRTLFSALLAMVMMAVCPQHAWADKTAKAVYDGAGTLTFYYDTEDHTAEGMVYELTNSSPDWHSYSEDIETVVFDSSFKDARPTSCYGWFWRCTKLKNITGIENLNTTKVEDMCNMFNNCSALTSLDLSSFNTENVTDMQNIFYCCSSLTSLNLSSFNTEKLVNMSNMFKDCSSLTSLDLSSFNTTNFTTMADMFRGCSALTSLNISSFDTSNVTNMQYMFYDCSSLATLELTNFNTEKVESMYYMFANCSALAAVDLSSFNTENVTSMKYMFENCNKLATIYASDAFVTTNVTDDKNTFYGCTSLKGGITYDSSKTTAAYATFDDGYLTKTTLGAKAVLEDNTMTFYYDSKSHCSGQVHSLNTGDNSPSWYNNCENVTEVVFDESFKDARPTSCHNWFCYFNNLKTITGLSNLNTSEVSDMYSMFALCSSLENLDLSTFVTDNVTDMREMFYGCTSLKSLNLSNFNTEKVTGMLYMFWNCSALESLDISTFNTTKVKTMLAMFGECEALTTLTLGNFNMEIVYDYDDMFKDDNKLTTITFKAIPCLEEDVFCDEDAFPELTTVNYQLDDNSVVYYDEVYLPEAETINASYTRNVTNDWGTLVVPFATATTDDVQLYELSAVSSDAMTFSPVETVAANTPCVFKKKNANATSVTFTASAINPAEPTTPAAVDGLSLNGTYEQITDKTGIYYIAADKFWLAEDAITVNPFRAYFTGSLQSSAKIFNIIVNETDGSATTIGTLSGDTIRNGKYIENNRIVIYKNGQKYNVNGQIME